MDRREFSRNWLASGFWAAACLVCGATAQADVLITVHNSTALPNSTGNAFDVTLTNTGPSTQNIADFALLITVTDTDISFDAASSSNATALTYIFNGDSFDYNDPLGPFPFASSSSPPCASASPQCIGASDGSDSGAGTTVLSGQTLGLAHIEFDVALGATLGPATVTLQPYSATNLNDSSFVNVTFTGQNGTITIGPTIPEPSTWLLIAAATPLLWLGRRRLIPARSRR